MTLRIFNTLSREIEVFVPIEPNRVRMYVCGMTLYDLCHMGHARFLMAFDVVYRWLQALGFDVTYVRNITDIDDKIIKRALERGIPIRQLVDEMTVAMHADIGALGIAVPTVEPRATDYVPQMLTLIATLEQKGLAYRASSGDVNFAVRKFPNYGKLSGKSIDQLRVGERVAVLDGKQDPLDFVLWKAAKESEPADAKWDSAFGPGRPGWHIECSAMSCAILGEHFDIHGGGIDLQFPHHENEIAQSECAHDGRPFARWWLHNGMLNFAGAKMSKSIGNIAKVHDLVRAHPPEALRYALLSAHYRQPLEWSDALIEQSLRTLDRLYGTLRDLVDVDAVGVIPASVEAALDDDLNTPQALAEIARIAGEARKAESPADRQRLKSELLGAGIALGLLQQVPSAWFGRGASNDDDLRIQSLIDERAMAKQARDFARSDEIRDQLAKEGVLLEDTPQGVRWKRA